MLAACTLMLVLFGRDWRLPGLYIDAVNPEYLIPGILDPPGSLAFSAPGNRLGDRFPVFTATLYHGSVQLYAALPVMAVLGASLLTLRLVQLLVGLAILALVLAVARRARRGAAAIVALCAAGTLAVEPSFVLALRTQAYSILFSVLLLLGAVWLLLDWRTARRPRLRLVVSGALYGLATFGYFVIAFFLPAMAWLVLRRDATGDYGRASRWHALALWAAGVVAGELPFMLGLVLLTVELGGLGALIDFLRASAAALQPGADTSGLLTRMGTVLGFFWSVAIGEWPRLQILQDRGTGALDDLRAIVLIALPALCLALRIGSRAERRALGVPVALIVSYLVVSLTFAGRLGGHHFTAVMPFLYLAFGMACASLWSAAARDAQAATRSWLGPACGAAVGTAILAVLASGLVAQERLHRDLVRTGGVGLYSDAIDRFAAAVDRDTPNATIHTPDFGFSLPLAFLSRAPHIRAVVRAGEIQTAGCGGTPQLVVLDGVDNEPRLALLSELIGPPAQVATWAQRDGTPVFQVARFAGGRACVPPEPGDGLIGGDGPAIALDPPSFPACSFLGQQSVVRVRWHAGDGAQAVGIHVTPPGSAEVRWTQGGMRGTAQTGPWAVPGMTFTLRDAATGRALATAVLASSPCPVT